MFPKGLCSFFPPHPQECELPECELPEGWGGMVTGVTGVPVAGKIVTPGFGGYFRPALRPAHFALCQRRHAGTLSETALA